MAVKDDCLNNLIILGEETVLNTYGSDSIYEETAPWNLVKYCDNIRIEVIRNDLDKLEFEFDLINVDAAIANAVRRVLLAEVPTMAIEKVLIHQNTSLIQDEVLAHRLGLIPIKADPHLFEWKRGDDASNLEPESLNTIVFNLHVKSFKKKDIEKDAALAEQMFENTSVYSRDIKWEPIGDQKDRLSSDTIRPVDDDILLAKLRPGQEIELTCYCFKGIGRDHAKFSPVATVSYRLLPEIRLLSDIYDDDAEKLQTCFSAGVIEIEQLSDGRKKAVVVDARRDTCSRNIFRYPELAAKVSLGRWRNHFMFSLESTGALKPEQLVIEAMSILQLKCRTLLGYIKDM